LLCHGKLAASVPQIMGGFLPLGFELVFSVPATLPVLTSPSWFCWKATGTKVSVS
jgi:hypothetical protein